MHVKVENINFSYTELPVLQNVSFQIQSGTITGLIGSNGSGKTTMLKIMFKKLTPSSGNILVNQSPVSTLSNMNHPFAFVPDTPVYYEELTVLEHLQFVKALYPQNPLSIQGLIKQLELQKHLHKIPCALSKGNLQKLMIALALLRQYEIFLADEPFTGLDPRQLHIFKQILQKLTHQHKAILISTHLLDLAEAICDRFVFLHNGQVLAEGSIEEITAQYHVSDAVSLEELYLHLTDRCTSDTVKP